MSPPYTQETTASELALGFASTIRGKTILTTGVSPESLGAVFVESIAKSSPGLLILAGRNLEKVKVTADVLHAAYPDVKVKLLELDLGSLASVRRAVETVEGWAEVKNIDVLVSLFLFPLANASSVFVNMDMIN
jgi:NADP-dependent 3-hydroxy acid dehydrogenase YdfG